MSRIGWLIAAILLVSGLGLVGAVWMSAQLGTQMCPLGCNVP